MITPDQLKEIIDSKNDRIVNDACNKIEAALRANRSTSQTTTVFLTYETYFPALETIKERFVNAGWVFNHFRRSNQRDGVELEINVSFPNAKQIQNKEKLDEMLNLLNNFYNKTGAVLEPSSTSRNELTLRLSDYGRIITFNKTMGRYE